MEIIDVALATTMGKVQNRPDMYGLVISKKADDLELMLRLSLDWQAQW